MITTGQSHPHRAFGRNECLEVLLILTIQLIKVSKEFVKHQVLVAFRDVHEPVVLPIHVQYRFDIDVNIVLKFFFQIILQKGFWSGSKLSIVENEKQDRVI